MIQLSPHLNLSYVRLTCAPTPGDGQASWIVTTVPFLRRMMRSGPPGCCNQQSEPHQPAQWEDITVPERCCVETGTSKTETTTTTNETVTAKAAAHTKMILVAAFGQVLCTSRLR